MVRMERLRDLGMLFWLGCWTALAIVGLDLVLKRIMSDVLLPHRHYWLIDGWIGLDLTLNRRFAFGLGPDSSAVTIIAVGAIAVLCVILARRMFVPSRQSAIAIGLIVGGAFANLLDRFGDQAVTDFIAVGPWPRFNLADSALTVGVGILILTEAMTPRGRTK